MVAAIPNKEEDDKWGHISVTAKKDYMILCAADQKTMPAAWMWKALPSLL